MRSNAHIFSQISRENVVELMRLSVRDDEKHLISPNPEWLAQAPHVAESQTYGIYHGGTAVGLISIIDPLLASAEDQRTHYQPNCLYVWRLMIDHAHRRQGHGRAAIEFALEQARNRGMNGVSLTTKDKETGNALPFYESLDFTATGRRLHDEIELIYRAK